MTECECEFHRIRVDVYKDTGKWHINYFMKLPAVIQGFETDKIISYVVQKLDYNNSFSGMYIVITADEGIHVNKLFLPETIERFYNAYEGDVNEKDTD